MSSAGNPNLFLLDNQSVIREKFEAVIGRAARGHFCSACGERRFSTPAARLNEHLSKYAFGLTKRGRSDQCRPLQPCNKNFRSPLQWRYDLSDRL
jgi:hypothetical protein